MIKCTIGNERLDTIAYNVIAHAVQLFNLPEDIEILVHGGDPSPGSDGECRTDDNGRYLLLLNANRGWTERYLVQVVSHEMVHVKQYVFDGLNLDLPAHTVHFRGEHYRLFNDAEYYLSPWEMEARGYEEYFIWRATKKGWIEA